MQRLTLALLTALLAAPAFAWRDGCNAAKAEFKRMIKDEFIRSLDSETIRADSKAALDAALAAISDPDLGQ